MLNLSELHLDGVEDINVQNFINFIRQRPKLERFYHRSSLYKSMQKVGEEMAMYCGNQIEVFYDGNEDTLFENVSNMKKDA